MEMGKDPKVVAAIREAREEIKAGKTITHEEVMSGKRKWDVIIESRNEGTDTVRNDVMVASLIEKGKLPLQVEIAPEQVPWINALRNLIHGRA